MLRIKRLPFVLQNRNEDTYQTVVTEFWIVKTLFTLSPEFLKLTLSCDNAIGQLWKKTTRWGYQSHIRKTRRLTGHGGIPCFIRRHSNNNGRRPEKQLDNMNKTARRIRLRINYNKTKTLNAIGIGQYQRVPWKKWTSDT